jgi:acyl carrier protein
MALPEALSNFIGENAKKEGVPAPQSGEDLFKLGILDSFSLVDLVSIVEEQCDIRIPDGDVNEENFRSLEAIERYIEAHRG